MSALGVALLLVRALPGELAVALARLVVVVYLLFRPAYRREIAKNLELLCNRRDSLFWLRNGWSVGRNLAFMAGIGTRRCRELIDRGEIQCDNSTLRVLEQELHIGMFSCHFGLWEFLPQVFARAGYAVGVLVGRQGDRVLSRMLGQLRGHRSIRLLSSFEEVRRYSHECRIVGFLLDNTRRGGQRWLSADGLRLRVPQVGFRLSRHDGRVTLPVWAVLRRGRLQVGVGRPGEPADVVAQLLAQVRKQPQEWILWGKTGALERAA